MPTRKSKRDAQCEHCKRFFTKKPKKDKPLFKLPDLSQAEWEAMSEEAVNLAGAAPVENRNTRPPEREPSVKSLPRQREPSEKRATPPNSRAGSLGARRSTSHTLCSSACDAKQDG